MKLKDLGSYSSKLITLAVAIAAVAIIASRFYVRIDVTEDHAYTLSEGSLSIANKLDRPVEARLYFTKTMKDMPPIIKQYGSRVEDVLREYATASSGKLSVTVIDPKPDTDDEEWAIKYGIQGIPTQNGSNLYLGVVFLAGEKEKAIPYLDPRKEEFLEYELSEALVGLSHKERPKLGLLSTLDLEQQGNEWALLQSLKKSFAVEPIQKDASSIPNNIQVLMVIHPKDLPAKTLFAIDQFVMRGGRLVAAVDPFSRVDLAMSQQGQNPMMMGDPRAGAKSDLAKLFQAWDIVYTPDQVVGDYSRGTEINAGGERVNYPIFMTMLPEDINDSHKITSNLRQILYAEGGAVGLKKDSQIQMTPLISTTDDSGTVPSDPLKFSDPSDTSRRFKGDSKKRVLAALFSGKFKSAFQGKAPADAPQSQTLSEATEDNHIIVIADVDMLHDGNAVNRIRFGPQTLMSPKNDNLNFMINAAEYMGGNQDLISIRSSGQISRPFTKVLEIQKDAQKKWQDEEERLSKELSELQAKLRELQNARTDGNRFQLTSGQQSEIKKFREQERQIRKSRRIVRKNLREDIEALGHRLALINLLATPACVAGLGLWVFRRRSRREREEKNHAK